MANCTNYEICDVLLFLSFGRLCVVIALMDIWPGAVAVFVLKVLERQQEWVWFTVAPSDDG